MSLPAVLQGNLSLPVICSPLFIISNPDLVIAQCKAGVVGSFPALNARPAEVLDEWLQRITSELADYQAANPEAKVAPFAVNQIVHSSNDRLQHDVELCVKYKVPIIITSLRAPNEVVGPIHSYGGLVFHDVINVKHAKKAIEAGVDGLILVCAGAGGHAGQLSPFALVSEIRAFYDGPIILSGSIAKGEQILAAQAMGADLAYMGTRFIATKEAPVHENVKQAIVAASELDTRLVMRPLRNTERVLNNAAVERIVEKEKALGDKLTFADIIDEVAGVYPRIMQNGEMDLGAWSCGMVAGLIHDIPSCEDLIERIMKQAEGIIRERLQSML